MLLAILFITLRSRVVFFSIFFPLPTRTRQTPVFQTEDIMSSKAYGGKPQNSKKEEGKLIPFVLQMLYLYH